MALEFNLTTSAQSIVDALGIIIDFLRSTDPVGALLLFIFGLWRGWWVMGPTHKEVLGRLIRVEGILDKLATGVQLSSAVTMGVVQRAHLVAGVDPVKSDSSPAPSEGTLNAG